MHKDLYWRSLKVLLNNKTLGRNKKIQDERLVPFIAFAIACGSDSMVKDALVLYTHCAQIQEFPTSL